MIVSLTNDHDLLCGVIFFKLNNFGGWCSILICICSLGSLCVQGELVISQNSFQVLFACAPGIVVLFHFVLILPHFVRTETQKLFLGEKYNIYRTHWPCEGCTIMHQCNILANSQQYFATVASKFGPNFHGYSVK